MARALLGAAVALIALAAWSSPASAAFPSIEVSVTAPEGDTQQAWLNEIEHPDVDGGPYWVRSPGGATRIDVPKGNGISLWQVLDKTETETDYSSIKIQGPGGEFELSRRQIDSNPQFQPFFYLDPQGQVHFLVPSTGPTDYNANYYFPITTATFSMTQTLEDVKVKLKASRKKIEPGESVTFTVTPSPTGTYRYDWTFEPGVERDNAPRTVTYRFKKAGKYQVGVGLYIGDDPDSVGGAGVPIQVGDPKKSDKDREGGGDNTSAGAPSSGTYSGSSGSDSGYTPYTPSTPAPTPAPPPTPSTEPPITPDIATSGTTVEGNLLADVSDPPPSNILEAAARAARDGNPKNDDAGGAGVSEAALSIAGVIALLGLGAGIETRQGRLPRLRLPRRAA